MADNAAILRIMSGLAVRLGLPLPSYRQDGDFLTAEFKRDQRIIHITTNGIRVRVSSAAPLATSETVLYEGTNWSEVNNAVRAAFQSR